MKTSNTLCRIHFILPILLFLPFLPGCSGGSGEGIDLHPVLEKGGVQYTVPEGWKVDDGSEMAYNVLPNVDGVPIGVIRGVFTKGPTAVEIMVLTPEMIEEMKKKEDHMAYMLEHQKRVGHPMASNREDFMLATKNGDTIEYTKVRIGEGLVSGEETIQGLGGLKKNGHLLILNVGAFPEGHDISQVREVVGSLTWNP